MTLKPILHWPDPRLSQRCEPVTEWDDGLRVLAEDMLETMYDAPGRGLAGPQIGVMQRIFVMDTVWKEAPAEPVVVTNPEILSVSEETVLSEEGCLSIPGVMVPVERPAAITLRWRDVDGVDVTRELTGFDALCAQHELDHLDGIVTFDRTGPEQRADLEAAYAALA